jgi:hypothetical protein
MTSSRTASLSNCHWLERLELPERRERPETRSRRADGAASEIEATMKMPEDKKTRSYLRLPLAALQ